MKELHIASANLITFLRRVPLFADLNDHALEMLARVSHTRRVPKGYVLFSKDDPGTAVYAVLSGSIAILLPTLDGRELVINEMGAGESFGELALLTGQPRSASAVAREASEVITIPCDEFLAELEAEPKLMRHLLKTIAQRLHSSSERESALAFLDAPARLARILLHLDQETGKRGVVIICQEELAQRVGVARQSVARVLRPWRRAGWIITGRGKIMLLNRPALRRQAEESEV